MKAHRARLTLLTLEDRAVPAVYNNPWTDPGNITISFAPDGTAIDGVPSQLNQELGPNSSAWQQEILRAFQTWGSLVNINVTVVPDDGSPFGTPGPMQGDVRHGDIRIGARSLGTSELATATPFDLFNSWSGEVTLNTDQAFNLGGTGGSYDVYSVFLHEAGHTFGLAHSSDPSAVMYASYQGVRTGLSTGDITNIKALYGARVADRFDANQSNDSRGSATTMGFLTDLTQLVGLDLTLGNAPYVVAGDLSTSSDVDYYKVSGLIVGNFNVCLRTSDISLLKAKVSVLNSWGQVLASATATDPQNGDLTLTVNNVLTLGTFYIKVEKAANDAFGMGAYRLAAGLTATQAINDPVMAGLLAQDLHSNDTPDKATALSNSHPTGDLRWDYTLRANVLDSSDADWYTVHSPSSDSGTLVVAVWGTTVGGVDPLVAVLDKNKQPVAVQVLTNDDGNYTLQFPNVVANSDYYIGLNPDPATGKRTGNYFFAADFRTAGVQMQHVSAGTLTDSAKQEATTLTVYQSQLLHFALATVTANSQVNSAMRMSILDANGNEVYTLFTPAGQAVSGDVLLAAGTYTVVFTAGTSDGSSLPDLSFTLDIMVRTDPIGMAPSDTSTSPSGSTSTSPSSGSTTTYSGPYSGPYRPS
jgi:predicted Zn-dependent protease